MTALPEKAALTRHSVSEYSGAERAAIVMLALGEQATNVFGQLDDDEIRQLSTTMSGLGLVPQSVVEGVIGEFFERFSSVSSVVGSFEQTKRMLSTFFPKDKADALMEELYGPAGRSVWEKLGNVNEAVLAGYLANEYPQTVAVVLSKLKPEFAARVLAALPEEMASEVVLRMLNMEQVHRDVLQKIESTLRTEFISNLTRASKRDSHELIAEIFNNLDRSTESKFLSALEGRSNESAERIKALMFVFEDLNKLDAGGVQTLLRAADKGDLALALKGSTDALRTLFFSNMSERGAKLMREDMQSMGPVRLRDVEAAQARVVAQAKELAARGELVLSDGKSDDELIY